MEREVDEVFKYKDVLLKVVKAKDNIFDACEGCYFFNAGDLDCLFTNNDNILGNCDSLMRKDQNNVIFKYIQKVE